MELEEDVITEKTWRARFYREEDKASLLRLSAGHYKDKEQALEVYVDWLGGDKYAGPALIPVCEELASGEIVGFAFQVPFPVKFGDSYQQCILGCNALVHPDYRRQGIYAAFNKLVRAEAKDYLFTFGFPKPQAVPPHSKVGKWPVSRIPLLIRPLDIGTLTGARFSNPLVRLTVNTGWWAAGNTVWRQARPRTGTIQVERVPRADSSFDDFWKKVTDKYEIIIPRDQEFLNWRFTNLSFRTYEIYTASESGDMLGYVVLRLTEIEGIPTGLIMDMLVEPGQRGEQAGLRLAEKSLSRFAEEGMSLAGSLMLPHTHENKILRRAGFVEPPERLAPQVFQLMVTSLSPKAPDDYLAKADRWFMSMANHDAV